MANSRHGADRSRPLADVESLVARMMTLDADHDGQLSQAEVKDSRLQSLFQHADANQDGVLSRAELTAYFTPQLAAAKEAQANRPPGGPGGFGPPPGRGGPGGPDGGPPNGPPRRQRPGPDSPRPARDKNKVVRASTAGTNRQF